MTITFLHTADWQLGKPFGSIEGDTAALLREERFEAVKRIALLATERDVDAVIVAGDVFDSATKTFEFPQLSRPHATILLAPSIKRLLRNLNFPDRINPRHPLTNEYLNLAKLRHDLFRIVSLDSRSLVLLY